MKINEVELALKTALVGTGMVVPVSSELRGVATKWTEVEILCKQVPGQEGPWLRTVDALLAAAELPIPPIHLCRRYVRKDGRMVFGWHIGLRGSKRELLAAVESVVGVLAGVRPTLDTPAPRRARQRAPEPAPEPEESDVEDAPAPPRRSQPTAPGVHPPTEGNLIAPGALARVETPQGFTPVIKIVENVVDEDGNVRIVEEMPLPHVYRELNRPNELGRGASRSTGNFHPAKSRR